MRMKVNIKDRPIQTPPKEGLSTSLVIEKNCEQVERVMNKRYLIYSNEFSKIVSDITVIPAFGPDREEAW